uniref:Uncharacterized protein n=1 Tax=Arundo donax TaxID=35708 RepID=A0A0A9G9P1_ARUDO
MSENILLQYQSFLYVTRNCGEGATV